MSFHFSFEVISKAHLELGLRTKQGRKASPSEHVTYIEREEAVAAILGGKPSSRPSSPEQFVDYQERDSALAPTGDGDAGPIFTNILGAQNDRMQLFAAIADDAEIERAPSLSISLDGRSVLMDKIRSEIDSGRLSQFKCKVIGNALALSGTDAEDAAGILTTLGWRDRRKKEARAWRREDSFGICHDPGKSDRVQLRLVGELPHEIDDQGRSRIVRRMCDEFEKRNLPYIAVIHAPGPNNDERNWHFHLVYHDRPAARFDGTAATHLKSSDANGPLSPRDIASRAKWLNEPSIQAQIGLWDFQVKAEWKKKSRNCRVSYPFAQRKDRDVTRKSFVPSLRALLSELTNDELNRAGVDRRVDPLSHEDGGRTVSPGGKLFAADHARELAGIPTVRGSSNARLQSRHRNDDLDEELMRARERSYISDEERDRTENFLGSRKLAYSVLRELADARKERAVLKGLARQADEVTEELFSRPRMMRERNQQLMLDAYNKPKSQHKVADYARQLQHIASHVNAMKLLGGDLFQIGRDARNEIAAVDERIEELEIATGLRKLLTFDFTAEIETAQSPPPAKETSPSRSSLEAVNIGTPELPQRQQHLDMPPVAPAAMGQMQPIQQQRTSPSSPPDPALRRKRVSGYISKIYDNRIHFELRHKHRDGKSIWVADIPVEAATRHGIPSTFELTEKHEQSRLINLGRERAARAREEVTQAAKPSQPKATNIGHDWSKQEPTTRPGVFSSGGRGPSSSPETPSHGDPEPQAASAMEKAPVSQQKAIAVRPMAVGDKPVPDNQAEERHTFAEREMRHARAAQPKNTTMKPDRTLGQSGESKVSPDPVGTEDRDSIVTHGAASSTLPPAAKKVRPAEPKVGASTTIGIDGDAGAAGDERVGDREGAFASLTEGLLDPRADKERKEVLAKRQRDMFERWTAKKMASAAKNSDTAEQAIDPAVQSRISDWRKAAVLAADAPDTDRRRAEASRDYLAFQVQRDLQSLPSLRSQMNAGEHERIEAQASKHKRQLTQQGMGMGLGR